MILFPIIAICEEVPPGGTYIVAGHLQVITLVNGYKVVACVPPYDVICLIITGTPTPTNQTLTCGGQSILVSSTYEKEIDTNGNTIFKFKIIDQ